jgi:hypothetical protein
MNWKKLACAAVCVGALVGCGGEGGPPQTYQFLVSDIDIPEPTLRTPAGPGTAAGFNIDGMVTVSDPAAPNCVDLADDYISLEDPAETGVDNALAGLLGSLASLIASSCPPGTSGSECIHALLVEQITSGSLLLVVEAREVNSLNNDTSVTVQLYLGRTATCFAGCVWTGTACTASPFSGSMAPTTCGTHADMAACMGASRDDASCTPELSGSTVAAGQTLETAMSVGDPVMASISGGRLRAQAPQITLMINAGDFMIPLVIRNARIGGRITESGMTASAIGGSVLVDDIVNAAEAAMMGLGMTARSLLEGIADIDPTAANPQICSSLSAGIDFTAVSTTLSP